MDCLASLCCINNLHRQVVYINCVTACCTRCIECILFGVFMLFKTVCIHLLCVLSFVFVNVAELYALFAVLAVYTLLGCLGLYAVIYRLGP